MSESYDKQESIDDEVLDGIEDQLEGSFVTTCPSCGGNMAFDPESGKLKCPYCQTEKEVDDGNNVIVEQCFNSALKDGVRTWNDDDIKSFSCQNCGAQLIFNPNSQAQFCNYCGSSHITMQEADKTIPPHYLVPFGIGEKDAGKAFKEWISKRWLAPNDLKNSYKKDKLLGTYVPHWTYDSHTHSFYTAQRGDYYYVTKTRVVDGKTETYQERQTRWHFVRGDYNRFFDDVLVKGSNKVDQKLIEKIQPFSLGKLKTYKPEYLSGFFAERYSISLEDGWEEGKREINDAIRSGVTNKIGGDTIRFLKIKTAHYNVTFKHILLPVWITSFYYKNKLYQVMINGENGKIVGSYPKSFVKIGLIVLLIVAIAAIGYYFNS